MLQPGKVRGTLFFRSAFERATEIAFLPVRHRTVQPIVGVLLFGPWPFRMIGQRRRLLLFRS